VTLDELLTRLDLAPHPEGGFFRETFRSDVQVPGPGGAPRAACTQILYALGAGGLSAWHRVSSDELWQHHAGGALELHVLDDDGHRVTVLGDIAQGLDPQGVVPAGAWQAARARESRGGDEPWALVGCTVAPGFDFADFEMAERQALLEAYPEHAEVVRELTADR